MKILFIITSSIAAIKCQEIIKILKNKGIYVDCIITENTKKIINTKQLAKILTGKLYSDRSENNKKMLHIELSRKSDLVIVCPATANSIAKFANGYADNLATTTLLASNKKIILVPAMNSQMWNNRINQKNVKQLINNGIEFVGPKYGKLYCGEVGFGRLANLDHIVKSILKNLNINSKLKGKKCIVTAGPTIENLDPVRFISNHSSGKQGYEIANQLNLAGAKVILISGPTCLNPPNGVKLIKTSSTKEMYNEINKFKRIDIGIFCAAVSDFIPLKENKSKLKKNNFKSIKLKENIDILSKIGNRKKNKPKLLIGFSAETEGLKNAKKKLISKKCDLIVYNKIKKFNNIFGSDYNQISIMSKTKVISYPKMSKTNCALKIIDTISKMEI